MLTKKKQMLTARGAGIAAVLIGGLLFQTSDGQAQTPTFDIGKVQTGLAIAPVPLNLQNKDTNLVGYGSYLVNAVADCNGCHSAGPETQFVPGGNPYLSQHPTVVNPATYMGGGNDFGAFPDPAGPFPHIISRNLTPDNTGLPEGGKTFDEFLQIIRTGIDMDHAHPTCAGPPNGTCLPAPFNGDLLQIMPWPAFQYMTNDDLRAIYTYLSAIPCLEGGPGEPPNRCTANGKTVAIASPKTATVTTRELRLDGSKSTSFDGKPLSFLWTVPQGSPSAGIYGANTATPSVQFSQRGAIYTFLLTVTDSTGKTSTDLVKVNY